MNTEGDVKFYIVNTFQINRGALKLFVFISFHHCLALWATVGVRAVRIGCLIGCQIATSDQRGTTFILPYIFNLMLTLQLVSYKADLSADNFCSSAVLGGSAGLGSPSREQRSITGASPHDSPSDFNVCITSNLSKQETDYSNFAETFSETLPNFSKNFALKCQDRHLVNDADTSGQAAVRAQQKRGLFPN